MTPYFQFIYTCDYIHVGFSGEYDLIACCVNSFFPVCSLIDLKMFKKLRQFFYKKYRVAVESIKIAVKAEGS